MSLTHEAFSPSVDLLTGSVVTATCQCLPTGLFPMRSDALFRITEISDRPVMLFDASAPRPRVWFVPPIAMAPAGRGVRNEIHRIPDRG